MAQAWDEPAPAQKSEVVPTFGQLPNIHVSEDFDEPLPDAEIAVWCPIPNIWRVRRACDLGAPN
jgi:hypothetical protein